MASASSLPPLVSAPDLEAFLGVDLDDATAATMLRRASVAVRACLTTDFVTDGVLEPVPEAVQVVTLEVAERAYSAPAPGTTQETAGPFSRTFSGASNSYYVTKAQKRAMSRWAKKGLYTLGTTRVDVESGATDYRPIAGGGEDLPMFAPSDLGPPI